MAPYFIRNLIPRREQRQEGRPLLEALRSITWMQWALFWSGYVLSQSWPSGSSNSPSNLDGWRGQPTPLTSSLYHYL